MEIVGGSEASEAVGALGEFVAYAESPVGGEGGDVGDGFEVVGAGVGAADDHGEGVLEAEAGEDADLVEVVVHGGDGGVDEGGVAEDGLLEDGGEGGAGVFDVGVDAIGDEGLLAEVGAGEPEAAFDGAGAGGFDFLGEEFAEDDLLGEVFGADDDVGGARRSAGGGRKEHEGQHRGDEGLGLVPEGTKRRDCASGLAGPSASIRMTDHRQATEASLRTDRFSRGDQANGQDDRAWVR